jgi:hypothetical protein
MTSWSEVTQVPESFSILGSTNGVNWKLVDTVTNAKITYGTNVPKVFNVNNANNTIPYDYYRCVVTGIIGYSCVVISEWVLNESFEKNITNNPTNNVFLLSTVYTYPPAALNNNNTTISGQSYGNGIYNITVSSILDNNNPGYFAFNKNTNKSTNQWMSSISYSETKYIGTNQTTDISNNIYKGEWIQIRLPTPIVLTSYSNPNKIKS